MVHLICFVLIPRHNRVHYHQSCPQCGCFYCLTKQNKKECVSVLVCMCMCVCVCLCERERESVVAPHLCHKGNLAETPDFVARKKRETERERRREDMARGTCFLTTSDNTHIHIHTRTHTHTHAHIHTMTHKHKRAPKF